MLSPLWWLPLAVAVVSIIPLWRGTRSLQREAENLRAAIVDLGAVRPLVAQLSSQVAAVDHSRRGIEDFGHR